MTTSEYYRVVAVPFPYVEQNVEKRRPALLVSHPDLERRHGLAWVLMITSADNPPWEGDIAIDDLAQAGLRVPSVIRPAKVATVETTRLKIIGTVTSAIADRVRDALAATLLLAPVSISGAVSN